ncbi:MAG: DNA polymerase III subunit alpha [Lachnospiraceae bacterium]|nr:DNA polymerase III subunit alpha [Lachnospiraceae bacterium]
MAFAHLHTHTEYSLLDGANKIKEYVARVKELGMTAAAITDHGVMYGVIDFYKACKEAGIKPIIGCEVYVAPSSRFDREPGREKDERYYHLVLLSENQKGYQNLMKLVSLGFTEGYYYKPRVDMEILKDYHEGLIALSACLAGEIPRAIVRGDLTEAEKAAERYLSIFGEQNFFLELQDHGYTDQKKVNQGLMALSRKLNIPLVATNDIHYTWKEDEEAHDILLCLQTGKTLRDENRMRYPGGQFYVKSEEEMSSLFPYAPEAIENTQKIADRCSIEIVFHETKLPHYDIPSGYRDSKDYLISLCEKGFSERYPNDDGSLKMRMDYELEVIEKMGYIDYFLIVWDYINYAKKMDIPVGPGRGSAAGSIVSYALKITDIDPVKYDLLFERFLNPERVSMPDIDVDFCFERRQDVIDYVVEKYGRDKCVQIITFGTLAAKGVLRDVSRVMDLPYAFGDKLARLIPGELNITLDKALKENNDFRKLYEDDDTVHKVVDMSKRLEGLPRHSSIHAAGILITPEEADSYVPLSRGSNNEVTTQFTMTTLEELGLLKMDFLGLRTLTVIHNAVKFVNARHPEKQLDISKIDYDDPKVLSFIATGETDGIFQLESAGMQRFMKELKPESLEDIIAGIALYRPGPMDFIPKYIAGKKNSDNVQYDCPELEPILKPTYGCIVYQEQVMQIVQSLGGYTLGRADLVRRAMSKKKQKVMEEEEANFVYGNEAQGVPGCLKKGISEKVARKIYADMMDFAKYAFNKSHAACYAFVTMQTAFLKTYYPVEFMAALLTSVMDNTGKLSSYMLSCRSMGLELLPPDINKGEAGFSPAGDRAIRYGLLAIRAVGAPAVKALLRERKENGSFKSLQNFIERMSGGEMSRRMLESLIKAGALDSLGGSRKQYLMVYASMMDAAQADRKNNLAGQMSLFDLMGNAGEELRKEELPPVGEFPKEVKLNYEKEVLGIYLTGHPLEEYTKFLKKNTSASTADFSWNTETQSIGLKENKRVTIGGVLQDIRTRQTKSGDTMAIIVLEDLVGSIECILWPRQYTLYSMYLEKDAKLMLSGRVKTEDEKDGSLIVETLQSFDEIPRKLYIQFKDRNDYNEHLEELSDSIKNSRGRDKIVIFLKSEKAQKILPDSQSVRADGELLAQLNKLYGEKNVQLV